jgi:tetratricopeptide (TPR) repeat protein
MFIGVYSSLSPGRKEGRGTGKRKRYWFVWDCGDEGYQVQSLDGAFQPQSEAVPIDPSTFFASFSLEPSILATPRKSAVPAAALQSQEGASPARTPEQLAAERTAVENHLRAHFGALLLKTRRDGDMPTALRALQDIAEVEEGIVPEHKYMFAEFGINLRKGKLPEIALAHAKRALSLAPGDSHAHFNIARIYHVLGKLDAAEQHLLAALEFAPDLEYAREFLAYLGKERRQQELDSAKKQRR